MITEKHTPTPWIYVNQPGAGRQIHAIIGRGPQQEFGEYKLKGDIPVAIFTDVWTQFPSKEWNEMQDANAAFIVEACNNYSSLQAELARLKEELAAKEKALQGAEILMGDGREIIDELKGENERLKAQVESKVGADEFIWKKYCKEQEIQLSALSASHKELYEHLKILIEYYTDEVPIRNKKICREAEEALASAEKLNEKE